MNKKIIASVLAVAFAFSMAGPVSAATVEELQAQISQLLVIITRLQAKITQIYGPTITGQPVTTATITAISLCDQEGEKLNRNPFFGATDKVCCPGLTDIRVSKSYSICVNCGDGICKYPENSTNCSKDCHNIQPAPECQWCGVACMRVYPWMACPEIAPPQGYICTEINGKCTSAFGLPTTTTTRPVMTSCKDSDGGINYYQKGTVIVNGKTYTDYCQGSFYLKEYFCIMQPLTDLRGVSEKNIVCPNGGSCQDGACETIIPISTTTTAPITSPSITINSNPQADNNDNVIIKLGDQITITGVPSNLSGQMLVDYERAFFFDSIFNSGCSNTDWTMTCTANQIGTSNFYIRIYKDGKTYQSNIIKVFVTPTTTSIPVTTTTIIPRIKYTCNPSTWQCAATYGGGQYDSLSICQDRCQPPTTTTISPTYPCAWCGSSCIRLAPGTMCPTSPPPPGYACVEINGQCISSPISTTTTAPTTTTQPPTVSKCTELQTVLTNSYGSECGSTKYNHIADLGGYLGDPLKDGKINFEDIMIFATNVQNETWCAEQLQSTINPCAINLGSTSAINDILNRLKASLISIIELLK